MSDEEAHCSDIQHILRKGPSFSNHHYLMPYYGYHYSVAFLCGLTHTACEGESVDGLRLVSTMLSFGCLATFFFLVKKIDSESAIRKSYLFLTFPLFFPYFFMLFTDIYSLMLVFLSVLLALNRRLWLSGLVGILSIYVRQNNIIWLVFAGMIVYVEDYYPQYQWKDVKRWIFKFFFFFLAMILIVSFVAWNKGVTVHARGNLYLTLDFGNLFFLLFLFFFLFLPYNLSNARKIIVFLKKNKLMWLILAECFMIYFFLFKVSHPWNGLQSFLHNLLLGQMASHKVIYFLPIAYAILSLCVTRLQRKSFYLLYPFTILFLLVIPLISYRYLFIPFGLFLALKEKDSVKITSFAVALYFIATGFLMYWITGLELPI